MNRPGKAAPRERGLRSLKGTDDIIAPAIDAWLFVEARARDLFGRYNYEEIRTPIIERSSLFTRSVGEGSDIVEKEIYSLIDRGGDQIALRPEATASVARAYIERGLGSRGAVTKLFYIGPMFRAERPQAGRFRQFHQLGAELFGAAEPEADVELIALGLDMIKEVGVTEIELLINTLGCSECRLTYLESLIGFLKTVEPELCQERCQRRIQSAPARVLDCKSARCQALFENAPNIREYLCADCASHFRAVEKNLNALEIDFRIEPRLVRGLDYYSRTVFEARSGALGAQNALLGGGRYDRLVENLGGAPTPAIGFALGLERLIDLIDPKRITRAPRLDLIVIALSDEARESAARLTRAARGANARADQIFNTGASLKSMMRRANKSGARFVALIGEDELKSDSVTLKNMETGQELRLSRADALPKIIH